MKDQKETLLSWLNDAYSMEKGQVQVLENHVKDAEGHPDVHNKLAQHLELTRRHADLVEQCIARLGGSTSSIKTAMGTVAGFFHGRSTGAAPDEMVKNALSDYAAEHFEIACYRALITGARAIGATEVVQVCEQILRDEEDMARWLESRLPMTVQQYLGAEVAAGSFAGGTPSPGATRL
jgi:ferritin-like metal-binding protein YciE